MDREDLENLRAEEGDKASRRLAFFADPKNREERRRRLEAEAAEQRSAAIGTKAWRWVTV